jgi:hypothetical protein
MRLFFSTSICGAQKIDLLDSAIGENREVLGQVVATVCVGQPQLVLCQHSLGLRTLYAGDPHAEVAT